MSSNNDTTAGGEGDPAFGNEPPFQISEASRLIIKKKIKLHLENGFDPAAGRNPDPDYSEFWVEAQPKEGEIKDILQGIPRRGGIGDPLDPVRVLNIQADDSNWSEEVWTEVTPDFTEMDPEPRDGRKANSILTMRPGKLDDQFEPSTYKDILRDIGKLRFSKD
jgi:hypothetical protein